MRVQSLLLQQLQHQLLPSAVDTSPTTELACQLLSQSEM